MQVGCPSCGHVLTVPADKAAVPNLKARCRCGTVFPVAGGAAPAVGPGAASIAPAKVAPPASDRVAAIRAANAQAAAAFASSAGAAPRPGAPPPAVLMGAGSAVLPAPKLPPHPPGVPAGAPLRTVAAVPRPAPAPATSRAAAAGTVADAGAAAVPRRSTVPVPWRRCQNHPQLRSEHVCPKCVKGFCNDCVQRVQTAVVCSCEGFCVSAAAYEELQGKEKQRDRSMVDEIPVIAGYPLRDSWAYVMLALFTWFFGLFSGFSGIMLLLSKGVLTWYSLNAVSRVASGNMRDVMPDFRDASDISQAARLSVAALAVSAGPLLLCVLLIPGATALTSRSRAEGPRLEVAFAQTTASPNPGDDGERARRALESLSHRPHVVSPFEAEREGPASVAGPLALLAIVVAVLWMVVYMPVALTVAALSKSILSTLNPTIGIDTIKKMGSTYWQALAIYAAILLGQLVLGWGLRLVPLAGGLAASFVDAYAALAVGCTLGMAVFKKAVALGWD